MISVMFKLMQNKVLTHNVGSFHFVFVRYQFLCSQFDGWKEHLKVACHFTEAVHDVKLLVLATKTPVLFAIVFTNPNPTANNNFNQM